MNGKEEIVDSLLSYVPLYIGMGFALFGIFYRRRHPDSPRGLRVMALSFAVALVACFGTSAVSLARQVIEDGATGLIVPLLLILPLGVLSLLTVRRSLLGKPSTTETIEHAERRSSVRLTLTLATFAALPAYAAGYGAGAWLMALYPDAPRLDLLLGVSATLAVVLSLIPWVVIEIRAAARRRAVANGHPSSPEIVDHVMTKATAARIDSALSYGHRPYYPVMFWAGAIIALLAAPALMQLTLTALGEEIGTTSSLDLTWLQALTICLALGVVMVGLIAWFIVPTLRDAKNELLLSALSAEQRLRWAAQAVPAIAGLHRFPGRLADPRRSVRVLTITESGDVLLEQIAAGDLLLERSEPLDDSPDDYSDDLFDDVDDDGGQLRVAGERIMRVLRTLAEDAGDRRFDLFALEDSTQAHIVAVGADDYLDFPEDLARRLIAA